MKSAFGYQGQKCSACSRAIVLDSVYDQFLPRLIEATRSLKVGPAEDPSARVGPVIDAEAFDAHPPLYRDRPARRHARRWPSMSADWPRQAISSARTFSPT